MAKRKPVSDEQLVAACLAWGREQDRAMHGDGTWEEVDKADKGLYALCMRAFAERKEKT